MYVYIFIRIPLKCFYMLFADFYSQYSNLSIRAHIHTIITQVRPVKADDIWLSPDFHRTSCHVTLTLINPSLQDARRYFGKFFESVSQKLKLAPRIHWGKYTTGVDSHAVESMYPRLSDFSRIRQQMDPHKIFINHFLEEKFNF